MKTSILTRVLCLVLLLSLVLLVAACETSEDVGSSVTSGGETTSVPEEESEPLFSNLPELTFNGADFVVLVNGDCYSMPSEDILPQERSDSTLQDAVKTRNDWIEERFDVKIKEVRTETTSAMMSNIRSNAVAGISEYDMVMPFMAEAATLAMEGLFVDLAQTEYIHLEESYYDQDAVNSLSVAHRNYFATGDLNLHSLACTHVIIFNKDMIKEYGVEDPYKLVKDGEWTIDKLREISVTVTGDTDGETGMSYTDTYGFLVNENFAGSMFVGAGYRFTRKDERDEPYISINESGSMTAIDKITELVNDERASGKLASGSPYYSSAVASGKTVWEAADESVALKRAMFRAISLSDVFLIGQYECNFGILPTPKLSTTQSQYYNRVSTLGATCVAIPTNVKDLTMSAVITDALMQGSTKTLKYTYFDIILKNRKIEDQDSLDMLDLIFDTRVYDLGSIYNWGGANEYDASSITGFLNSVCFSPSINFASTWEKIEDKVQTAMEKTLDVYRNLKN